jgi:hypothetical protein
VTRLSAILLASSSASGLFSVLKSTRPYLFMWSWWYGMMYWSLWTNSRLMSLASNGCFSMTSFSICDLSPE